jgi:hypothetical protein
VIGLKTNVSSANMLQLTIIAVALLRLEIRLGNVATQLEYQGFLPPRHCVAKPVNEQCIAAAALQSCCIGILFLEIRLVLNLTLTLLNALA